MNNKLTLESLMESVGCRIYPTRWQSIFESVMDEYEQKGCYLLNQKFYDDLQKRYGCFSDYGYVYAEAIEQVAGDEMLARFLLLLATALQDDVHKEADLQEFARPVAPVGKNPIGYEMITALAMCSQFEGAAANLRQKGISDKYIRDVLLRAANGVQHYMSRHHGDYGFDLLRWSQKHIDGLFFPIGQLEITLDSTFKGKAIVFRNQKGDVVSLAHQLAIHRSGMALGSFLLEDEENSWVAEIEERDDAWIGYPFMDDGRVSTEKIHLSKKEWSQAVKYGDPVVGLHIPPKARLESQILDETLEEVNEFLRTYFPELEYKAFTCTSWLMSTQLEELLGGGNLVEFSKRFHRLTKKTQGKSVFSFVFLQPDMNFNIEDLPERTSLERALKQLYLSGKALYDMHGFFF